jgi:threonine/homoserine/homoserine lactone efflux protein
MSIELIAKGLLIGVIVAAPVGPTGIVCVQRIISIGRMYGLFTGIGAGIADLFWGCVSLYGVHYFAPLLLENQQYFKVFAGVFLLILGLRTLLKKRHPHEIHAEKRNYLKAFGSGFLLTISNVVLVAVYTALFTSLGILKLVTTYWHSGVFLSSIFIGSVSWWFLLGGIYTFFKHKFHKDIIVAINKSAGVLLLVISSFVFLKIFV